MSAKIDRRLSRLSSDNGGHLADNSKSSHHVTLRPGRVTAPQRGDALSGHWSVESSTDLPCRRRRVLPATPTTSELRTSVRAELRRDDDVTSTAICYKLPSTDLLSDRAPGAVDRSKRRKHLVQADRCQMSPVHFQAANSDYDDVKISDERINETADSKVKYYGRCGQREHIDKFAVSSVSTNNIEVTADEWNQQHGVADKPAAAVTSDNQSCRPLLRARARDQVGSARADGCAHGQHGCARANECARDQHRSARADGCARDQHGCARSHGSARDQDGGARADRCARDQDGSARDQHGGARAVGNARAGGYARADGRTGGQADTAAISVEAPADKSSRRRHSRQRTPSDSDSDDERRSTGRSKHRSIRPPTFDGTSQSFAAFKAQFENAASFNLWRDDEQLAHLKSCLVSLAAQALWDTPKEQTDSLSKLWKLLEERYGGRNVAERYRTELRARKLRPGETLNSLFLDIKRLVAMGYPSEPTMSTVLDCMAKDSFISALPADMEIRVREKEPTTLDDALHVALRLEAIYSSANSTNTVTTDGPSRGKLARGSAAAQSRDESVTSAVLSKLNEMQTRFDAEMKELNNRMTQMEDSRRAATSTSRQHPAVGTPLPPSEPRAWSAAARQPTQSTPLQSTRRSPSFKTADRQPRRHPPRPGCFRCGDRGHRVKDCPVPPTTTDDAAGQRDATKSCGVTHPDGDGHVYLAVSVHNRSFLALVDSGCELNIAPPSVACGEELETVSQRVFAANGTPIEILGRVEIPINLGGNILSTDVLISPDVAEIMLSYQWLNDNRCVWDFRERTLCVNGQVVPLCSKKQKSAVACRRVFVQDDVVIPPRQCSS